MSLIRCLHLWVNRNLPETVCCRYQTWHYMEAMDATAEIFKLNLPYRIFNVILNSSCEFLYDLQGKINKKKFKNMAFKEAVSSWSKQVCWSLNMELWSQPVSARTHPLHIDWYGGRAHTSSFTGQTPKSVRTHPLKGRLVEKPGLWRTCARTHAYCLSGRQANRMKIGRRKDGQTDWLDRNDAR